MYAGQADEGVLKEFTMGTRRIGFTLVELLVVISIVALLLTLLLPSLSRARGQAKLVRCGANLHQLAAAMEMYASSNRGWFPRWSVWHVWGYYGTELDGTGGDEMGPAWSERLRDDGSLVSVNIYRCPSFPSEVRVSYFEAAYAAWNRYQLQATRQGWVKYPSSFVLGGDCTNPEFYKPPWGANVKVGIDDADMDDASLACLDWSERIHMKSFLNVMFGDGHVSAHSSFTKSAMTFDTITQSMDWGGLDGEGGGHP